MDYKYFFKQLIIQLIAITIGIIIGYIAGYYLDDNRNTTSIVSRITLAIPYLLICSIGTAYRITKLK